jgi:hypothetical protein
MENTGLPTVGCYATKTGLPTVGYCGNQQYRGGERIHGDFNYGCLAMGRVPHSNDGIRPNTSQYISIEKVELSP